jgi:hypothetical protein
MSEVVEVELCCAQERDSGKQCRRVVRVSPIQRVTKSGIIAHHDTDLCPGRLT